MDSRFPLQPGQAGGRQSGRSHWADGRCGQGRLLEAPGQNPFPASSSSWRLWGALARAPPPSPGQPAAESSAHIAVPSCPLPTHAITTATTTFTSGIQEPATQGLMAAFPPLCHVTSQVRTWLSWGPLFCQLPSSGLCRFPALHRDLAEDASHWEGLRPHPGALGCWAKGGNLTRAQRAAPAPRGGTGPLQPVSNHL